MKAKKIMIVYVKGFIDNLASIEKVYSKVVKDLVEEDRKVRVETSTTTIFEDGTYVTKVPFYGAVVGKRLTHLYIDEKIYELATGKTFVDEVLTPLVVAEGVYENVEATGKPSERIMVFGKENGMKTLDKYNK